jgi:hypothetical protein
MSNSIRLKSLVRKDPYTLHTVLKETLERLNEEDIDPKSEDEVEKAFSDAMSKVISDFSAAGKEAEKKVDDENAVKSALKKAPELEKVANESLRRRNKALMEGNIKDQRINEVGVLFAVSLAVAIPRIVELIGKAVKIISVAMGGTGKVGEKLQKAGHKWHDKIIKFIMKGLTLIPGFKELPMDKQEKIAKLVHMLIVGSLAVASGAGAVDAVMQGKTALAGVEGALTAVKAGEIGVTKFLSTAIAKILG